MRKMPERTCVITKEKTLKKDLLRVVRNKEGNVSVDLTGKANGRGAYLKKDLDVINKARQTKALDRILEVEIPESIYDEMITIIEEER
ncbi:MAG TPA: YlxR family protein [Candidatus Coprovivens excrementavium]|nr:YlxR family protein [Candidatus Coprovivens excrementavium]